MEWIINYTLTQSLFISKNFYIVMASLSLFILASLVLGLSAIQIPLKQGQTKCMLIYATAREETIKIDIDFPYINQWGQGDSYYITFMNTQTHKFQKEHRGFGHFRREIMVDENVVYELCFQISSPRQIHEELMVEYNADTHHMIDKNSVKIPDSLLKIEDMQEIYKNTYLLSKLGNQFIELQANMYEKEEQEFMKTDESESKIILVSVIQIILISAIAGFQLVAIKKKFEEENSCFLKF